MKSRHLTPVRPGRFTTPGAILFDLDGTLVDTMGPFADVAADVIAKHFGLGARNARHLYLQTSGIPFAQQLDVMFGDCPVNAAASEEFERRKHEIAAAAELDGAALTALERLRRAGIALVVSSNGHQAHVDRFAARYDGLFQLALGFGNGLAKGEPHVARVCAHLGLARPELIYVGDSLHDGELAERTGVRFVARAGTFTRRDLLGRYPLVPVIDHVAELVPMWTMRREAR